MSGVLDDQLVALADPERPAIEVTAAQALPLLEQARRHGVLPIVLRKIGHRLPEATRTELQRQAGQIAQAAVGAVLWLDGSEVPASKGPAMARPLNLDDAALILMTSGTTGRPKGIAHSIRSLLAKTSLNTAAIGAPTMRETLCVLPVFSDMACSATS